jgi:hypothetical protein
METLAHTVNSPTVAYGRSSHPSHKALHLWETESILIYSFHTLTYGSPHSEINVASLYVNPSTSSPSAKPGKIKFGPFNTSFAGLIHCGNSS